MSAGSCWSAEFTVSTSSFSDASPAGLLGVHEILKVKVASIRSYPLRGIVTVIPSSSLPTPAPLQSLVGWALADGIVPVHVICAVWPALAGTAIDCVEGVEAPMFSAAAANAAPTSVPIATSRRREKLRSMRVPLLG